MGGAYAAGMAYALMQNEELSRRLQFVDYLAPYQSSDFEHPIGIMGRQFNRYSDILAKALRIKGIDPDRFFIDYSIQTVFKLGGHLLDSSFRDFISNSIGLDSFLQKCLDANIPIYYVTK